MPGIFGIVTRSPKQISEFQKNVNSVWPDCKWEPIEYGVIGANGLPGRQRIFACHDYLCAIEGDRATGRVLDSGFQATTFFQLSGYDVRWNQDSMGCGCVYRRQDNTISLTSDYTAGFPLFYYHDPELFVFSTLQRPIAKLIAAERDLVGITQYMRAGYTVNGRTVFRGIKRLLPGENLRHSPLSDRLQHTFDSAAHAPCTTTSGSSAEVQERAWSAFQRSVRESFPSNENNSLMFSAGWDSRTVLAAIDPSIRASIQLFSHGDTESREMRLARQLAASVNGKFRAGSIGRECFDLSKLERDFPFSEHLAFPHWTKAAETLASLGCTTVGNGVFGEVMGGHYGPVWFMQGADKYFGLLRALAGRGHKLNVTEALHWKQGDHPRWLSRDCSKEYEAVVAETNADISATCARYEQAGLHDPAEILELFLIEHRASQWIMAQPRSQKHLVELAIPFGAKSSMLAARAMPINDRVHNRQNRKFLKKYSPNLLRLPTGAILVPASAPTLVQETSRIAEWLYENHRWQQHIKSKGNKPHARLGWDNYEFLRDGEPIAAILTALKSDLWDKDRLKNTVLEKYVSYSTSRKGMGISFEALKLLSVDLLLR